MADTTWKARERQVAKMFGTVRNALSGGNSKITRSDSLHKTLHIETKYGKRHKIWTLYDKTLPIAKAEDKIPVLAICQANKAGALIVIHSMDFKSLCIKYLKGLGYSVNCKRNAKRVECP